VGIRGEFKAILGEKLSRIKRKLENLVIVEG